MCLDRAGELPDIPVSPSMGTHVWKLCPVLRLKTTQAFFFFEKEDNTSWEQLVSPLDLVPGSTTVFPHIITTVDQGPFFFSGNKVDISIYL
jgi:hypothetical protein